MAKSTTASGGRRSRGTTSQGTKHSLHAAKERLVAKLQRKQAQLGDARDAYRNMRAVATSRQQNNVVLQGNLANCQAQVQMLQAQYDQAHAALQMEQQAHQLTTQTLAGVQQQVGQLVQGQAALNQNLATMTAQHNTAQQDLALMTQHRATALQRLDAMTGERNDLQLQLGVAAGNRNALRDQLEQVTAERDAAMAARAIAEAAHLAVVQERNQLLADNAKLNADATQDALVRKYYREQQLLYARQATEALEQVYKLQVVAKKTMATLGHMMGPLNARRYVLHKVRGSLGHGRTPIPPHIQRAVENIFQYKRISLNQIDQQIGAGYQCPSLFPDGHWVEKQVPGVPRWQTDKLKNVLP